MTRFDRFHGLMLLFTTLSKVFRLFICHKKTPTQRSALASIQRWHPFSVSSLIFVQRKIRRTVDQLFTSQQKYAVTAIFKL
ncbi:hypothetical protein DDN32_04715 [Vibrio cholerae]|nr:hypothetical protein [Vibrio cholerae]EGR2435825.1 hypothetical protein [Vibrio cholerae]EGR2518172.1 hypothetical protein [Vibrio cholerae]EGR4312294.1 hypothetical protein [Vibrio cholerae]EGR4405545.1 hypothetical protein [Vibrio cholerae]